MTKMENRVMTQTSSCAQGLVFSFACSPGDVARPLEEQSCCGEKLQPLLVEGGRRIARCKVCNREFFDQGQIHDARSPWIGVDLDGTLASDTGGDLWDTEGNPKIGRPVDEMVNRIKAWIAGGVTVKIFTARASSPAQVRAIRVWLARGGLPDLEVTNVKDLNMVELWDDRCVQVIPNSGRPVNYPMRERQQAAGPSRLSASNRQKVRSGLLFNLRQIFLTI
jgi:hypothetical protein